MMVVTGARSQTVQFATVDLTAGSGPTSSHVKQTWFETTTASALSAGLSIRLGQPSATRPVLALGYDAARGAFPPYTLCP
jgi:hypothetical protein